MSRIYRAALPAQSGKKAWSEMLRRRSPRGRRKAGGKRWRSRSEMSGSVGVDAGRLGRLDALMQGYIDRGVYAGIATMVARRGMVVHVGHLRLERP